MAYSLKELCQKIGIEYEGEDRTISGINTLADASSSELSFLDNKKYLNDLKQTKAAAVLLQVRYCDLLPKGVVPLISEEPYLKLALATALFAPKISTASKPPQIGKGCDIDPSVRFGCNVNIGDGSVILAGCYIGDNVTIGKNSLIYPNVTIYHGCTIGDECIIHSGAVIGSDGYGFAHTREGKHIKIYQLGAVCIGDRVEIGANTTIDRGALGDTIIGSGTKIDNLVQIGHNCKIGKNCLIVAQVGMAGSTVLGDNVELGGQSATAGHLSIGDSARFAARSGVTKSMNGGKTYGGAPAVEIWLWKRQQAALMRLARKK